MDFWFSFSSVILKQKHTRNGEVDKITIKKYKGIARVCRGATGKAKAQLELKLARDVKSYAKGFLRYISRNRRKILAHC